MKHKTVSVVDCVFMIIYPVTCTLADIATVNRLNAKSDRESWEREFNARFIQPVLGHLDVRLNTALDLITNDDKQGKSWSSCRDRARVNFPLFPEHGKLFYLAYERMKVESGIIDPHLWSYHQRISLEHLGQDIQQKKLKDKHPVLHEFLHMVGSYVVVVPCRCIEDGVCGPGKGCQC
jgi:hypothetical protein